MSPYYVRFLSIIILFICSCTSKSDLPFDAGYSSISVPEELLGNWMTGDNGNWLMAEGASELIISEDSITWQEVNYKIAAVYQLAKNCMILGVAGDETLALFPDEVSGLKLSAAITDGKEAPPLDENGEILRDKITEFERWWYPLGKEYPAVGTKWVYSSHVHGDHYTDLGNRTNKRFSKIFGSVILEVTKLIHNGYNDVIELRKTVHLDTLHIYINYVEWWGDFGKRTLAFQDSLLTDYEYSEDIRLFYSNDTLYMDQDTVSVAIAPRQVRIGSIINLQLYSVGIGCYSVGQKQGNWDPHDLLMKDGIGVSHMDQSINRFQNHTHKEKYRLELLEHYPGN